VSGGLAPLASFGTLNVLTSSVNGVSLGRLHPAHLRMINGGQEDVNASPISLDGAFSSTALLTGAGQVSVSWEPAQYGSSQVSTTDSCLAAFSPGTYRVSRSSFTVPKSAKKGAEIRCVVTASADGTRPASTAPRP
jgi:hypothetical protein